VHASLATPNDVVQLLRSLKLSGNLAAIESTVLTQNVNGELLSFIESPSDLDEVGLNFNPRDKEKLWQGLLRIRNGGDPTVESDDEVDEDSFVSTLTDRT
jgi:hypothetical protein